MRQKGTSRTKIKAGRERKAITSSKATASSRKSASRPGKPSAKQKLARRKTKKTALVAKTPLAVKPGAAHEKVASQVARKTVKRLRPAARLKEDVTAGVKLIVDPASLSKAKSIRKTPAAPAVVSGPASKATPSPKAEPKIKIPAILLEGDEPVREPLRPRILKKQEMREQPESGLPEAFGTGKLLLIPRDVTSLYAAWDFTAEEQRRANALSVDGRMTLLIWKGVPGREIILEIPLHPESRYWFVNVPEPGELYSAELGYYDPQRNWRTMAVSSTVEMPRPVRQRPAITFQTTESPGGEVPKASIAPSMELQAESVRTESVQAAPPQPREPQTWQEQASPSRATQTEPVTYPTLEIQSKESATDTAGRTEWTEAQAREILELSGVPQANVQALGSIELLELLAQAMKEAVPPVSSLEMVQPAPEQLPGPVGISSLQPAAELPPGPPGKFWFQVNAELVIYGATEPDALVTIGGRPIRLREDGSFSYRFALPDGSFELPIQAQNFECDIRAARLTFSRHTTHTGEVGVHPQDPGLKKPSPENIP